MTKLFISKHYDGNKKFFNYKYKLSSKYNGYKFEIKQESTKNITVDIVLYCNDIDRWLYELHNNSYNQFGLKTSTLYLDKYGNKIETIFEKDEINKDDCINFCIEKFKEENKDI